MSLHKPTAWAALVLIGTLAAALAETPAPKEMPARRSNAYHLYTAALQVSDTGVAEVPSRFRWSVETNSANDLAGSQIMLRLYDPDHNFTAMTAQMDLATAARLHHELGTILVKKLENPNFQHQPQLYDPKDIPTKRFVGVDENGTILLEEVPRAKLEPLRR